MFFIITSTRRYQIRRGSIQIIIVSFHKTLQIPIIYPSRDPCIQMNKTCMKVCMIGEVSFCSVWLEKQHNEKKANSPVDSDRA